MTPPTEPRGTAVYPGIAELKAEPSMAGFGPLWQINGRLEGGAPDDPEAWGWLAEVSSAWDDTDGGELSRFLVKAAHAHAPLVEALEACEAWMSYALGILGPSGLQPPATELAEGRHLVELARAALKLARGEGS